MTDLRSAVLRKRSTCPSEGNDIPHKRLRCFDYTNLVPNEIWVYIFSYISQEELYKTLRSVSKRWRLLVSSSVLWTKITADSSIPSSILCTWIERSPLLKQLRLKGRSDLNLLICKASKFSRQLKRIKIEVGKNKTRKIPLIKSRYLCNLIRRCKLLKEIDISGATIRSKKFLKLISTINCSYFGTMTLTQMKVLVQTVRESNTMDFAVLYTSNNTNIILKNKDLTISEETFWNRLKLEYSLYNISVDDDQDDPDYIPNEVL